MKSSIADSYFQNNIYFVLTSLNRPGESIVPTENTLSKNTFPNHPKYATQKITNHLLLGVGANLTYTVSLTIE